MHVHQDRTDKLNDELTMQAFVSGVDLREETFGKFWVYNASHLIGLLWIAIYIEQNNCSNNTVP